MWSAEAAGKSVRRNATITAVPNSSIKIGYKTFTLHSSVHMLSSKGPGTSYISVVLSHNKWIFCDNQVLTGTRPKGAKRLYLAFYKHVSAHRTKSKLNMPHSVGTSDSKVSVKRKVAELANDDAKCSKKPCIRRGKANDIKRTMSCDPEPSEHWGSKTGFKAPIVRTVWPEYRYYPIDEEWQRQ